MPIWPSHHLLIDRWAKYGTGSPHAKEARSSSKLAPNKNIQLNQRQILAVWEPKDSLLKTQEIQLKRCSTGRQTLTRSLAYMHQVHVGRWSPAGPCSLWMLHEMCWHIIMVIWLRTLLTCSFPSSSREKTAERQVEGWWKFTAKVTAGKWVKGGGWCTPRNNVYLQWNALKSGEVRVLQTGRWQAFVRATRALGYLQSSSTRINKVERKGVITPLRSLKSIYSLGISSQTQRTPCDETACLHGAQGLVWNTNQPLSQRAQCQKETNREIRRMQGLESSMGSRE